MSVNKVSRTENWDREEKCFLLELIREHILSIEDKRGDVTSLQKKNNAWEAVVNKFRSKYGSRSKQQIKAQYQRLKLKAKEDYRKVTKSVKKTGGGSPQSKPSALSQFIFEMLPGEFTSPCNPFDEDSSWKK